MIAAGRGGGATRGERSSTGGLSLRLLDLAFASVGLVVAGPVLIFGLIAIPLESPGGAIFAQNRVGRDERVFTCYKLRTMKAGSASVGTHEISSAQVTRLGRVLRRLKVDELPQLFNVIRGDMSLVGPRPCLPNQDAVIAARRRHEIFSVLPGVTGEAQLAGIDMSTPERLALADRANLQLTLGSYLSAVVRTAVGGGRGDRVAAGPQ